MKTAQEDREWSDNHDWLSYSVSVEDEKGNLLVEGRKVEVRWIFQSKTFSTREEAGWDTEFFRGLAYDREGTFYGVMETVGGGGPSAHVRKLAGKAAFAWFAERASWDVAFTRELLRAIDSPSFEFLPLVPSRLVPKQRKRKAKAAETIHQQLLLATALVSCVQKLEADPCIDNLTDAMRSASAVHQALHQTENFKLISAA